MASEPPAECQEEASASGRCNDESLMLLATKLQEAGSLDPSLEDMVNKIKKLQQVRDLNREELQWYHRQLDATQKEQAELKAESLQLQETLSKKQETLRMLQLQCDTRGAKNQKQQQLTEQCKQRLEHLNSKIQEVKLKWRKQRIEFENQLEELMKQHKSPLGVLCKDTMQSIGLYSKNEQRLAAEIIQMEEKKEKLLAEEGEVKGHLVKVLETADWVRQQGVKMSAENTFLRSPPGSDCCLFQEENTCSKAVLERTIERHSQVLERYMRLMKELEAAGVNIPRPSQAESEKVDCVTEAIDMLPATVRGQEELASMET